MPDAAPKKTGRARVAVVTSSYPAWDGDPSGHFVAAEVAALRESADVQVFVPRGAPFGWPGLLPQLRAAPFSMAPRAALAAGRVFVALRRAAPFDRAIAHFLPTAILCRGVARDLEVVVHGSDLRVLTDRPRALAGALLAAALGPATRIRVVSDELAAELLAALSPAGRATIEPRVVVAPPHLTVPDLRDEIRERSRSLAGRRTLVCAARLVPEKGVARVLEYVAACDPGAHLVVLGDGPERAALQAAARRLGVEATFAGTVARHEALVWLGAADAVLHGSRREGASSVRREAAALGTPFVCVA